MLKDPDTELNHRAVFTIGICLAPPWRKQWGAVGKADCWFKDEEFTPLLIVLTNFVVEEETEGEVYKTLCTLCSLLAERPFKVIWCNVFLRQNTLRHYKTLNKNDRRSSGGTLRQKWYLTFNQWTNGPMVPWTFNIWHSLVTLVT